LSKHIGRKKRWEKTGLEKFESDDGIVQKDPNDGSHTWTAYVKEGFSHRCVGRGYKRARNAMMVVEEAAEHNRRNETSRLPPIRFQAHIFG
jgi:hypothetical protein